MNGHLDGAHLSDDQLLDGLYGLADHAGHLESCPECAGRWSEMRERRASLAEPLEVPYDMLAAQRRKIYARLGEEPRTQMKWIPAVAAACLLAAGVFLYRPAPVAAPTHTIAADAQLFSEVYSMEQSTEPIAGAPIHGLFEDNQ